MSGRLPSRRSSGRPVGSRPLRGIKVERPTRRATLTSQEMGCWAPLPASADGMALTSLPHRPTCLPARRSRPSRSRRPRRRRLPASCRLGRGTYPDGLLACCVHARPPSHHARHHPDRRDAPTVCAAHLRYEASAVDVYGSRELSQFPSLSDCDLWKRFVVVCCCPQAHAPRVTWSSTH